MARKKSGYEEAFDAAAVGARKELSAFLLSPSTLGAMLMSRQLARGPYDPGFLRRAEAAGWKFSPNAGWVCLECGAKEGAEHISDCWVLTTPEPERWR